MDNLITTDWKYLLEGEFKKDYFINLMHFLDKEYNTSTIFPKREDMFTALNLTPYSKIKVVILGQDPYHGPNQSHGLSFSVNPGVKVPPSLRNIFKELKSDIGCFIPNNGYLKKWADQGVLLLNTVLTVRSGEANSHKNKGWELFTDEIITLLNKKNEPIIFILWGNPSIKKSSLITNTNHLILTSVHPSPLSASRGFFGSKPFSKANNFLESMSYPIIDWQIENI